MTDFTFDLFASHTRSLFLTWVVYMCKQRSRGKNAQPFDHCHAVVGIHLASLFNSMGKVLLQNRNLGTKYLIALGKHREQSESISKAGQNDQIRHLPPSPHTLAGCDQIGLMWEEGACTCGEKKLSSHRDPLPRWCRYPPTLNPF